MYRVSLWNAASAAAFGLLAACSSSKGGASGTPSGAESGSGSGTATGTTGSSSGTPQPVDEGGSNDAGTGDITDAGLPVIISEAENTYVATWTWTGSSYNAVWNEGSIATMTVVSFTPASVIINRVDTTGVSAGLTAVYNGQISGKSIVNASATWTWPGHAGYPATGTWVATWQ